MKKFFKFLVVAILVIGAIVGACFLFFQNKNKVEDSTTSLLGFLQNENKNNFDESVIKVGGLVNSDSLDERFNLIIEINENLDNSFEELITYLIDEEVKVEDKNISNTLYSVISYRSQAKAMIEEYNIKANHKIDGELSLFDRHVGANDLFTTMVNYSKSYAKLVYSLNEYLDKFVPNKTVDLKFNMIEIYTQVVQNTLKDLENNNSGWLLVKNDDNLEILHKNNALNFINSFINSDANKFSSTVSNFNNYFEKCNKNEFCKNLSTNISNVEELKEGLKNHEIATYWFEEVLGI